MIAERKPRKPWTYKGVNVYPSVTLNSSGIRWYALDGSGVCLRADSKQGMRQLISKTHSQEKGGRHG